jgi:hypothetical protein
MNNIIISHNQNKLILERIIQNILINECKVSVIGYDNLHEKYWFKIENEKKTCILFAEIFVVYKNKNNCEIIINPIIFNEKIIKNFVKIFQKCLEYY